MEVLECIKKRRSVRDYEQKEVSWDYIANIIDAGRNAPSAGNLQNWKFIIVLEEGKRQAAAKACLNQMWMAKAPVHIVIVAEPEKAEEYYKERGKTLYTTQNCAAAAENMILEAENLGLSSCWVGAFVPDQIRKIFGMPSEVEPQIILTIGYPAETPKKPGKWPLENITYFNGWKGKIQDGASYMGYYSLSYTQPAIEKTKVAAKKAGTSIKDKAIELKDKIKEKLNKE